MDKGNGVFFKKGSVGAGPDDSTASGYLLNRITNEKVWLWIYDFSASFSATGTEAQSRLRKEFFPRYFTQPQYLVKGQTSNQYEHQRLSKFIRLGMLMQVSAANSIGNNPYFEAFVLRIEGRPGGANRNTKGGHMGWTLEGYIQEVETGGERFNFAPEFEFTFVLANATEGPMKVLDTTYIPQKIGNVREAYLLSFNNRIDAPKIKEESKDTKPSTRPKSSIVDAFGD